MAGKSTRSLSERFWAFVPDQPGMDCWEWQGSKNELGYGRMGAGGRHTGTIKAHRVAYSLCCGEIPEGLAVCHACDNPGCVNPSHLWLGTKGDNTKDMLAKGRARNGRKERTHCKHGHPFDETNTYVIPSGGRACIECRRKATREAARRRNGYGGHEVPEESRRRMSDALRVSWQKRRAGQTMTY